MLPRTACMEAAQRETVEAELSSLFERRLGGLMLVRLELTDVLEKFKREEHALATSLRGILQLRDRVCKAGDVKIGTLHHFQDVSRRWKTMAAFALVEVQLLLHGRWPRLHCHWPRLHWV